MERIQFIKQNFDKMSFLEMALELNISAISVVNLAKEVNLKSAEKFKQLVDDRRAYVDKWWETLSSQQIADVFGVSTRTISKDAVLLKKESKRKTGSALINKDYTAAELDFIKKNTHLTLQAMADTLNRPLYGLKHKLKELGLSTKKGREYSEEENAFIARHLDDMGFAGVAKALNSTYDSIRHRARVMGLR